MALCIVMSRGKTISGGLKKAKPVHIFALNALTKCTNFWYT